MASFVYIYSDGDFRPNNISMFGYTFNRETSTSVSDEVAEKLDRHPHFRRVLGNGNNDDGLAVANAIDKVSSVGPELIDKSGLLEASGIVEKGVIQRAKKAAYMREYMARKRAQK